MSQFPGDKGSEFLAGTLGGPGYGEFPLGSAGPRVDTSDPRYRAPPQPGGGGNMSAGGNPSFDMGVGNGMTFNQSGEYQGGGRMVTGVPEPWNNSNQAGGGGFPIARRIPDDRMPQPAPGNGGIFDKLFPRRNPQPSQQMPTPGAGNLFARPDTAGYDQKLSDYTQQQYRNAPSPYEQQAEFLMNRPVFDRGARPDDPMMTFQRPETQDPIAMMAGQQPLRDAANAAANKAQQDQLAAQEAAANQAAADARTLEEAAAAQAEQERIAVEKAAADAAAMQEAERIAAEEIQQRAAEAAAAQAEAGAQAAAAQAAAEAESIALAKAAEDQRLADLQERLAALDGRFGGFDPGIGGEGGFGGILNGFDPAAMQANIAAAQAAAATNAETIAGTPSVDPGLQARIDAMQGELGNFQGRFEGFDPADLRARIEGLGIGGEGGRMRGATSPGFVAPTDRTVQKSREGVVGRNLGGMDNDAIRARIAALGAGTPSAPAPAPVRDRIGTLGGTGYGEFPLGSAGPRAGGQSYDDVVAAGNGGINPRVGTRADGTAIRLFDPDNPNRQSNPAPSPKRPQIDPSSLFSDPGLGGGRATPLPKTRTRRTVKTPPPPKAPQPPRSGPKPRPRPKPKPKAPLSPRSGPKPKVISDPAKEKAKAKARTYPRRGRGRGR